MIGLIFALWSALHPTPAETEALRATAPFYLTTDSARENLVAARIAAALTETRTSDLLAIAFFESNYDAGAVTKEPGHKVSCGIMTPIPKKHCTPGDVFAGYLRGAVHWRRDWLDNHRCRGRRRCAILGYAGGGRLIDACRVGPYYGVRYKKRVDLCTYYPETRLGRSAQIRRALSGTGS